MPLSIGLMPRARSTTNAAPISPNTAPDAPTVLVSGSVRSSAPNEPLRSDDEVDQPEAQPPDGRLQQPAEDVEDEHVEEEVEQPGVKEAAGHEPPPLAVGHRRALERALAHEGPPAAEQRATARHLAEEGDDVGPDQHIGERGLARSDPIVRTGVRCRAHSGQRMPTDVAVMHSGQIGRSHDEQETPVSRSGWR